MKKDFSDIMLDCLLVLLGICFILALIFSAYVVIKAVAAPAKSSDTSGRYYATSAVVVEIDSESDTVVCEDFNGSRWAFRGVEDWCIGDGASLLMYDNGTPWIYDDEVKDAGYTAWKFSR